MILFFISICISSSFYYCISDYCNLFNLYCLDAKALSVNKCRCRCRCRQFKIYWTLCRACACAVNHEFSCRRHVVYMTYFVGSQPCFDGSFQRVRLTIYSRRKSTFPIPVQSGVYRRRQSTGYSPINKTVFCTWAADFCVLRIYQCLHQASQS